jgi:branched-chain amino acid transport system ATP-binding protein
MLSIRDLSVSFGPVPIVRNASLDLQEGEFCGLIGRNGAGKTTMMRALMGAIPASGKAELERVDLMSLPAHRRVALGVGYMPEDRRLVPEFSCEENVRFPALAARIERPGERLRWIYGLIPELDAMRARRSQVLSGGQQKLVALGRALMAGRRLLLLDEPFEGLAPALAQRLAEILFNLKNEGVTVLIAESSEGHLADLLSRSFRIERGSVTLA